MNNGTTMQLILPEPRYYESYLEAIREYREQQVEPFAFCDPEDGDLFERFKNMREGRFLPKNFVAASYLWLVEGERFIGEISIRHVLTAKLKAYGGNIGYGVRYSDWNKGYGTEMLARALVVAKNELGLSQVLITCNEGNVGSARVIEKNGGVLGNRVVNKIYGKKHLTRRYWITL